MIPSSEARFFVESSQEIFAHDIEAQGRTIAVLLYPDDDGTERHSDSLQAYICSVGPTVTNVGSNRLRNTYIPENNKQVIMRFSASAHVNLKADSAQSVDQIIKLLQNILGNVNIKLDFLVSGILQSHILKSKIEKSVMCEIQEATYCTLLKPTGNAIAEGIKGCVFSLSANDCGDAIITKNPIPTPLVSISLIQKEGKELSSEKETEKSSIDILLQQCLKRLLVNKLVICPASSNSIPSTPKSSIEYHSEMHNSNGRTLITLSVPSLNSEETFTYEVNEVLHQFKSARNIRQSISNIFMILPSTRITLIHGEKKENTDQDCTEVLSKKTKAQTTSTTDLILNTINAIRHISLLKNGSYSIDIPRAFLLSGPPGVGKTHSVRMAVNATNAQKDSTTTRLVSIRGSEILSSGASEADAALELEKIFTLAVNFASRDPENVSVIFMDECDALLSSDVAGATIGSLLDRMTSLVYESEEKFSDRIYKVGWRRVVVIAATNRIDSIPAFLRRPGRIDRELLLSPPNSKERCSILESLLRSVGGGCSLSDSMDKPQLLEISELCVGYVPADLASLVRRAAYLSAKEGNASITYNSLRIAMKDVGASALRDSTISAPPSTRWDDIAGDAGGAKTALRRAVEWPQVKKEEFEVLGLSPPRGILLHGPPGCAKTTLARAAAGAAGIAFLSLSPADVYASSYVGEAEAIVRRAFSLARSASPCILFFDEIDSIVSVSSSNASGMDRNNSAEARVLSTFLNEMDGVDGSIGDGVLVLGATNRPSTLDSALIRPGRFDRVIYVPNPDKEGRLQILKAQCQKWQHDAADIAIDLDKLSNDEITGMMTGAEIVGACREAAMSAIREMFDSEGTLKDTPSVQQQHLEKALALVKPLLSNPEVLSEYTSFEEKYL